jgi:acetoin utilization protein AcuB
MDRISAKRAQVLAALQDDQRQGGLLARDVMTVAPSCVGPTTTTLELIDLFHAKMFRHLLVTCPDKGLVGVISDRDVVRCIGPDKSPNKSRLAGIVAGEIMSTDLITIGPNTPLDRAVQIMVDQGISCLPILAESTPVGILTNTDLHMVLQALLQTLRQASSEESVAEPVSNRKN